MIIYTLNFTKKTYRQIAGTPTVSPLFADMIMDEIETEYLNKLKFTPSFFYRYVDDVIICTPSDQINSRLNIFNQAHKSLKFTYELESNQKSIQFLDIMLINKNNKIITNWHQKSICSSRILHFQSHHPKHQKIAMVYNLVDKAIKL